MLEALKAYLLFTRIIWLKHFCFVFVFLFYYGLQGTQRISGTVGNSSFWGFLAVAEHEAHLKE